MVLAAPLYSIVGPVTAASAVTVPEVLTYTLPMDTDVTKTDGEKLLVPVNLVLRAGESRKLVGNVNATMITNEQNMDDTATIKCRDAAGALVGIAATAEVGIVPGETKTLRPSVLFTPKSDGVYSCQLLAETGSDGPHMTVHQGLTALSVSAADEVGSYMWQNPPCDSKGLLLTCTYLGESGGPTEKFLLDNDGSAPYQWTAADSATAIGVTANVELTECGHTASCGGIEHDGGSSTVSSHLEVMQLDALGNPCNVTRSSERTDVIGILNHHYNITYGLPGVPVLATCGGSRNFRVAVDMKWISGNSVKIDGSRPDPLVHTNAVATNAFYAPATSVVPSVFGLSQAAAQSTLAAAHLNVGTVTSVASSAPPGTVIAQNAPTGAVEPINSRVNLTVSLVAPLNVDLVQDKSTKMGVSQSLQLSATGGVGPYLWSVTGLPAGMSFTSSGFISGTPTVLGVFPVSYTLTDGVGTTTTRFFTWTVTANETRVFTGSATASKPGPALSLAESRAQSQATGAGFSLSNCEEIDSTVDLNEFRTYTASATYSCFR